MIDARTTEVCTRTTEVWMVRHTSVDVTAGTCYGRSDVPLRETFATEAEEVRCALQSVTFDTVWSSPLGRCTRLAEACGHSDARRDDRLREIDFGAWEMCRFDQIDDPALQLWYDDYLHARPTGGESFDELRARVAEFLEELRGGGRILVFAHGGVILAAGIHAGLWSAEEAFSNQPPYGGIIKLTLPAR
ncbi:MAG: alpha-ribazole phosphatase [Alistipes sp.]|jgi:alpha-ribazole phosphatase|nr:alpha-ribazole phosphatase [Alistipes sp.]